MKIATWNVNSVRTRQERLLRWLEQHRPDALCVQELKCQDAEFPHEAVARLGYHVAVYGQKTYNGVAILGREPLEDVVRGFSDGAGEDPQARLLAATMRGVRLVCGYFPNGSEPDSDKYVYKQAWLARLMSVLSARYAPNEPLVLCGDFNIAADARDVAKEAAWEGSVLYNDTMRAAFASLLRWGMTDLFRVTHPDGGLYSWWDYRNLSFPRNDGLRIDYLLGTAPVAARLREALIDRDERKGDKPSDHAPVVVVLDG